VLLAVLEDEVADRTLRAQIEADRGLVEEDDARRVEQRRDELHLHAPAEGEAAQLDVELLFDVENGGEVVEGRLVGLVGDAVDLLEKQESVGGGEVPPELRFLAHDEGDLAPEAVVALPGRVAEHARLAPAGVDDPGQHLHERRLARPVRTDQPDDLALLDGEGDLFHGLFLDLLPPEERLQGAEQAGRLRVHGEGLGELGDFDHPAGEATDDKGAPALKLGMQG
jgi:hypothetical protein